MSGTLAYVCLRVTHQLEEFNIDLTDRPQKTQDKTLGGDPTGFCARKYHYSRVNYS